MPRSFDDFSDLDPLDERGLLKDGHRLRIPMTMRDSMNSMQRAVAKDREAQRPLRVVDELGNDGLALCRPGSRHLTAGSATADSAVLAVQQQNVLNAYRAMVDAGSNAWRRSPAP
jgi:hypothetical protein